jgi:hypothetical protein
MQNGLNLTQGNIFAILFIMFDRVTMLDTQSAGPKHNRKGQIIEEDGHTLNRTKFAMNKSRRALKRASRTLNISRNTLERPDTQSRKASIHLKGPEKALLTGSDAH